MWWWLTWYHHLDILDVRTGAGAARWTGPRAAQGEGKGGRGRTLGGQVVANLGHLELPLSNTWRHTAVGVSSQAKHGAWSE